MAALALRRAIFSAMVRRKREEADGGQDHAHHGKTHQNVRELVTHCSISLLANRPDDTAHAGRRMRGEARVQRGGERRYYRCPGPCSARLLAAEPAEEAVLDTMSKAVLPAPTVEAARDELRRRLSTPNERSGREKRPQLEARLERLRKQHEWGDLNDAEYRAKRAEVHGEMSQLAEGNKVILFDRNRQVMTSMAQNISAATTEQRGELARLLIDRAVATDGLVEIEWSGPARPFFDHVGGWCPQGDSNP